MKINPRELGILNQKDKIIKKPQEKNIHKNIFLCFRLSEQAKTWVF